MKRTVLLIAVAALALGGCETAGAPNTSNPTPYTQPTTKAPQAAPQKAKTTAPAPEKTAYQTLSYGSAYRLTVDEGDVSIYVSDPANSRAVTTNSGTQIVTFNITVKARSAWSGDAAKIYFDSKTNEDFYQISGSDPLSDNLKAGATKVYKMSLEAPMNTYKQGTITLTYNGKKIATWS